MQPGAVGGAGHHQVEEFAGSAVADAVDTVPYADERPLLFGLVVVFAQTNGLLVLSGSSRLNDAAGAGSDGVKTICFDHSLCNSFHDNSLQTFFSQTNRSFCPVKLYHLS